MNMVVLVKLLVKLRFPVLSVTAGSLSSRSFGDLIDGSIEPDGTEGVPFVR
jgi:hypothetical protein